MSLGTMLDQSRRALAAAQGRIRELEARQAELEAALCRLQREIDLNNPHSHCTCNADTANRALGNHFDTCPLR